MLEHAISFSEQRLDDLSAVQINVSLILERHLLIPIAELDIESTHKASLLRDIEQEVYGRTQQTTNELERVVMATCKPEQVAGLKEMFDKLRDATMIKRAARSAALEEENR